MLDGKLAPGGKKNVNSLTSVNGDGTSPGLVKLNVNFVPELSAGIKSVLIGAIGTTIPNFYGCCCGWCDGVIVSNLNNV
jgi:hypothetical protein